MITRRPMLLGFGASLLVNPMKLAAEAPDSGIWNGILDTGSLRLRLVFELRGDGTATVYSPDETCTPLSARIRSLPPDRVEFEVPAVDGLFRGKSSGSDRIEGTWTQGFVEVPLVLMRGNAAPGRALPPVKPLTSQTLEAQRHDAGMPALGAAAEMRGRGPKKWVSGERLAGSGVAVSADDAWHLGSITKSITATLVARLVESDAVHWDDTVGDSLKNVAPDMRDAYRSVTFRHLLSHRSGLPFMISNEHFSTFPRESTNVCEDRRRYAREALRMAPVGPKELTFAYSNSDYVVAGAMLETKLNSAWEDLVRTHVFEPLKLMSAGFGAPGEKGKLTQPVGHTWDGKQLTGMRVGEGITDNPDVLGPAGRVHMSVGDVLTYLSAHRDATPFLKPDTWRTLHTPPFVKNCTTGWGDYAMGWVKRPDGTLWHSGANTLWYAEVLLNSDSGISATAATNDGRLTGSVPVGRTLLRAVRTASDISS